MQKVLTQLFNRRRLNIRQIRAIQERIEGFLRFGDLEAGDDGFGIMCEADAVHAVS